MEHALTDAVREVAAGRPVGGVGVAACWYGAARAVEERRARPFAPVPGLAVRLLYGEMAEHLVDVDDRDDTGNPGGA